jgi:hypothetical protein
MDDFLATTWIVYRGKQRIPFDQFVPGGNVGDHLPGISIPIRRKRHDGERGTKGRCRSGLPTGRGALWTTNA